MKTFRAKPEIRLALASAFVLVACGGGGGGDAESAQATTTAGSPTQPSSSSLTFIDTNLALPTGDAGRTRSIIEPTTLQVRVPGDGVTGAFRTVCQFSHMNYDDAIVFPGQSGAAHLHTYFGNKGANASSTPDLLRNSGASTCLGGTANRSAYWIPSMIAPGGQPMAPADAVIYYKTGYQGARNSQVEATPHGLRMIAGNSKSTAPQSGSIAKYGCGPWEAGSVTTEATQATIPTCRVGEQLLMEVFFPQCWDGRNLDSPDHKSHMAYGDYLAGCPASHPRVMPAISIIAKWRVNSGNTAGWRLSSDINGTAAGSTAHADWFNGWDPVVMDTWVQNCLNRGNDCGTYLLGDGTLLNY